MGFTAFLAQRLSVTCFKGKNKEMVSMKRLMLAALIAFVLVIATFVTVPGDHTSLRLAYYARGISKGPASRCPMPWWRQRAATILA